MKKTCRLFLLLLTLMMTLSGCITSEKDIYQRINEKYSSLNSYYAKCEATVWGNKTKNKYEFEVYFKSPDMLKLDYITNGIEILMQSDKVVLKNPGINHTIELNGENCDYINFLINAFFENYYVGETGSVNVASRPISNYTLLECELASGNDYARSQKLYIDNKTTHPKRLLTLDAKGDVVIEVEFTEFNFNDARIDAAFN